MDAAQARPARDRLRIAASFYAILCMGVAAGANGVLLAAQITDYGVTKSTIGWFFLFFSGGYITSAVANGVLIGKLGLRSHLMLGAGVAVLASVLVAFRPGFMVLLVLQAVIGFGTGALDAGLNSYLSTLPRSASVLNFFHGFFGLGALIGPVVAAAFVSAGIRWTWFYALLAVLGLGELVLFMFYPRTVRTGSVSAGPAQLGRTLRLSGMWLGAGFLGIYVGIEVGFGNWGFSFLTEARAEGVLAAGWVVSGYWAGLTLGRFVLNALAERVGLGVIALSTGCIGGVALGTAVVWLVPVPGAVTVGLIVVGFFLGPLFPTMIATLPRLVPHALVESAIGVLVAVSVAGGAFFPWVIGASMQAAGAWVLVPLLLALCVPLGLIWVSISRRVGPTPDGVSPPVAWDVVGPG
jgi:fucose permease